MGLSKLYKGCIVLALAALAVPASAQTTDRSPLRERIQDDRIETRRTVGERELERSNSELERRRRTLVRQQNRAVGATRSIPILPKTRPSSVVVNQ